MKTADEKERKPVKFHDKAKETLKEFSKQAQHDIGELLLELQDGEMLTMPDARPMRSIAAGAYELRVRDTRGIYHVFYYLKYKKCNSGISRIYEKDTADTAERN